jgi:indolepyruvate ferredoxin oxidoreductase beta subunit
VILSGAANYPQGVIEDISSKVNTTVFKAAELAEGLGNIKTMNVIIVGALVKALGLENIVDWNEVIKETVKEKFIDINVKAFNIGLEQVK